MSDDYGLIEGDICNREGCNGVMSLQETDTQCSCHINPPCSHCVDATYSCNVCEFETEKPEIDEPSSNKPIPDIYRRLPDSVLFDRLPDNEFGYITIAGEYYWMEYKGKYPQGMPAKDIVAKFNTCFGYKWLKIPKDGTFHIKVYTD